MRYWIPVVLILGAFAALMAKNNAESRCDLLREAGRTNPDVPLAMPGYCKWFEE